MSTESKFFWLGVGFGGVAFVATSYILHCHFGLGPWACQRADRRRVDAVIDAVLPHHQHPPVQRPI